MILRQERQGDRGLVGYKGQWRRKGNEKKNTRGRERNGGDTRDFQDKNRK